MSKEAEEYFTQDKIDKIQYETDDDNGVIDEKGIVELMESYHQHRLEEDMPSQTHIREMMGVDNYHSYNRREAFMDCYRILKQHLLKTNK